MTCPPRWQYDEMNPAGRFFLNDAVLPSDMDDHAPRFDEWVRFFAETAGPNSATEAEVHLSREYSTYDWIMEGLLVRAGVVINRSEYNGFIATYLCTRPTRPSGSRITAPRLRISPGPSPCRPRVVRYSPPGA